MAIRKVLGELAETAARVNGIFFTTPPRRGSHDAYLKLLFGCHVAFVPYVALLNADYTA